MTTSPFLARMLDDREDDWHLQLWLEHMALNYRAEDDEDAGVPSSAHEIPQEHAA